VTPPTDVGNQTPTLGFRTNNEMNPYTNKINGAIWRRRPGHPELPQHRQKRRFHKCEFTLALGLLLIAFGSMASIFQHRLLTEINERGGIEDPGKERLWLFQNPFFEPARPSLHSQDLHKSHRHHGKSSHAVTVFYHVYVGQATNEVADDSIKDPHLHKVLQQLRDFRRHFLNQQRQHHQKQHKDKQQSHHKALRRKRHRINVHYRIVAHPDSSYLSYSTEWRLTNLVANALCGKADDNTLTNNATSYDNTTESSTQQVSLDCHYLGFQRQDSVNTTHQDLTLNNLHSYCSQTAHGHHSVIYLHTLPNRNGHFSSHQEEDYWQRKALLAATSPQCWNALRHDEQMCHACGLWAETWPFVHYQGEMWQAQCDYVQRVLEPYFFQWGMRSVRENWMNLLQQPVRLWKREEFPLLTSQMVVGDNQAKQTDITLLVMAKLLNHTLWLAKLLNQTVTRDNVNFTVSANGMLNVTARDIFNSTANMTMQLTEFFKSPDERAWILGHEPFRWDRWLGSHPSFRFCDVGASYRDEWYRRQHEMPDPMISANQKQQTNWVLRHASQQPSLMQLNPKFHNPPLPDAIWQGYNASNKDGLFWDYLSVPGQLVKYSTLYKAVPDRNQEWLWKGYPHGEAWNSILDEVLVDEESSSETSDEERSTTSYRAVYKLIQTERKLYVEGIFDEAIESQNQEKSEADTEEEDDEEFLEKDEVDGNETSIEDEFLEEENMQANETSFEEEETEAIDGSVPESTDEESDVAINITTSEAINVVANLTEHNTTNEAIVEAKNESQAALKKVSEKPKAKNETRDTVLKQISKLYGFLVQEKQETWLDEAMVNRSNSRGDDDRPKMPKAVDGKPSNLKSNKHSPEIYLNESQIGIGHDGPKTAVFYHAYSGRSMWGDAAASLAFAKAIAKEQLKQIQASFWAINQSSFAKTSKPASTNHTPVVFYDTVGDGWTRDSMKWLCPKSLHCHHVSNQRKGNEGVTLARLYSFCTRHTDATVVYLHNMGNHKNEASNHAIRRASTAAALSEQCYKAISPNSKDRSALSPSSQNQNFSAYAFSAQNQSLSNSTAYTDASQNQSWSNGTAATPQRQSLNNPRAACGLLAETYPFIHFSGNMWHARCDHISTLLPTDLFFDRLERVQETLESYVADSILTAGVAGRHGSSSYMVGKGRLAWDHWVGSTPNLTFSDVSGKFPAEKQWKNPHISSAKSVNKHFVYRTVPQQKFMEAPHLHHPFPDVEYLISSKLRHKDFLLLPGYMVKYAILYQSLPAPHHWIWDHYPDGDDWRERFRTLLMSNQSVSLAEVTAIIESAQWIEKKPPKQEEEKTVGMPEEPHSELFSSLMDEAKSLFEIS